jgi:hypothetical protein
MAAKSFSTATSATLTCDKCGGACTRRILTQTPHIDVVGKSSGVNALQWICGVCLQYLIGYR